VYLEPDRPAPLADLARELGLTPGGLTREADRLERAGVVRSERVGRQRLLHANRESVYYPDLYGLLLKAFGPATVIAPALVKIPGVERAFLFGSWAARYLGTPGEDPHDIDLMVVGEPSRTKLAGAARRLTERLGRAVNVTIVSPERWEAGADGFIRQVRGGPLVDVITGPEAAGA
jgi:predicted nucleotidyltransferase